MQKTEFLPRIQDEASTVEERLTLISQFVALNGLDAPVDLLPASVMPRGFVFRAKIVRDLVLCVAIAAREAQANAKEAVADSAQLWQLWLDEDGSVHAKESGIVCTLTGMLTKTTHVDDRRRADAILAEWTSMPPTKEELSATPDL